ncbi:MAG: T9SS type A sorting domain-containing protein [Candidatus Cloacimonetes bacterium]|nr:T9SS type A sorting domain-containing protein [Candidatus Cloacimonadota bacterium]
MLRYALTAFILAAAALLPAYEIAQLNRSYVDPDRDNRQISTQIYYPVPGSSAGQEREAFPLLVFGHGWILPASTYATLRDQLVSQGWIMAFPTTEGGLFPSHQDFALDLDFVAQSVLAENFQTGSELVGMVTQFSVLMGHSMGGGAAVLAATDTVADALLTLAAADTDPSAIAAAQQVSLPSLTLAGGSDSITPPSQHQLPIFQNLASSYKSYLSFTGVGHLNIYTNPLVIAAILAWLDYAISGDIAALIDYFNLLEQNQGELTQIHSGYPEVAVGEELPGPALACLEVFPNPAASATISYSLDKGAEVSLEVFDLRGRRVRSLFGGNQAGGTHSLSWDGRDDERRPLAKGQYLARLRAAGKQSFGRITLLD